MADIIPSWLVGTAANIESAHACMNSDNCCCCLDVDGKSEPSTLVEALMKQ